jgi:hypothetical protein
LMLIDWKCTLFIVDNIVRSCYYTAYRPKTLSPYFVVDAPYQETLKHIYQC